MDLDELARIDRLMRTCIVWLAGLSHYAILLLQWLK